MVVAEVCSSMKYPKRCQYKHAKQKKYHVSSVNYLSRSATTRIPVAHPSSSTTSNNVINVRSGAAPEGVDD